MIPYEIIGAGILGLALGLWAFKGTSEIGTPYFNWGDTVFGIFLSLLITGIVTGVAGFIPAIIIGSSSDRTVCVNPVETPLVNFSDGSGTTANFFLGSGYVGSDLYYYYYYQLNDGGYQGASIDSNSAEIKYLTDGKPRVVTYTVAMNSMWKNWGIPTGLSCGLLFYIPQGSIKEGFSVGK